MSNFQPSPYNNISGVPQTNAQPGPQYANQYNPTSQPSILKEDANSNSPVPGFISPTNQSKINHFNQSASSSPAFNQSGMMNQPIPAFNSSPLRPPIKSSIGSSNQNLFQNIPSSSANPNSNALPYHPKYQEQQQINHNTPPLLPSSQFNQPLINGPPSLPPQINQQTMQHTPMTSPPSSSYSPVINKPPATSTNLLGPMNPSIPPTYYPPVSVPPGPLTSQPSTSYSGPLQNSPLISGPPMTRPPISTGLIGQIGNPRPIGVNGPIGPMPGQIRPNTGLSGPTSLPPTTGLMKPPIGPQIGSQQFPPQHNNGLVGPNATMGVPGPRPQMYSGPSSLPMGPLPPQPSMNQMGQIPNAGLPSGPLPGPPKSNIQNRYPQMPQSSSASQQPMMPPQPVGKQFQTPYTAQAMTQQMGQLSVTKQGFDQLWGHQMMDLLQCRHILPEYPEDPPEIRLSHQFADAPNCSPEIFRCTVNRIPDTNSLLQKCRLPLGILIHPFKDLNNLPVIQCSTIVRCRACRTYINPFVYFVDAKRWKCNLCYRVNDLPEEFQYDPVSKSYGEPTRRPEIKSATIEFIAPGEYMLRPPQPAVYLFLFDVSQIARDSGYLQVVCDTLKEKLDELPGDARTQVGFICYDAHVHYYLMADGLARPKELTVIDIDDVFLPSPESLLVNLGECRDMILELLTALPRRHSAPGVPVSALGAALQAAYKLMAPTGGRITVFQTCLPNIGPGALQSREDPNSRSSKEVAHLNPASDFYKRLALDCSGAQVAVDLFLLSSQYCDLATLSGMSKFSAGTVYHIPLFRAARAWQAEQLQRMLTRYLTRKIGFEAVMRVRCTKGIAIHTFHGNFFVRSTDLLSLPNVSPDAGFGMQLTIEESVSDLQHVCFQAALLYTSSKGERRIRVHTLALPIATNLTDVLHSADQQCIIGLLSKMAVDRCASASMSEAREALMNVAVDALSAHRLARNLPAGAASSALHAPASLRLLPLYLLALLKRKAFRTGTSTRLDERVADMCDMKTLPLGQLLRAVYPDLYPVHELHLHIRHDPQEPNEQQDRDAEHDEEEDDAPDPPRLQLTAERLNSNGAYLLDDGSTLMIYVCCNVSPAFLSEVFGVGAHAQLPDEARSLPRLDTPTSRLLHAFIDKLNDDRPYPSGVHILRDTSPTRQLFTDRLVDDRVESAFSYYEFLQHVKNQVK
ncbi:Protein transport protein Sec24A [Papilio xuthus]|uniref:Protein transport protein Sec24A n=1 Tax=Papilio xuthus TaxID=66420 RepID=A0A194PYC5_PAPXU|nr:Protein transport protein Sec24A [Papilio xuthus]